MTFRFRMTVILQAILFIAITMGGISSAHAQDNPQEVCQKIKPIETIIKITYDDIPVSYELKKSKQQIATTYMKGYKEAITNSGMEIIWMADDLKIAGLSMAAFGMATDYRMRSDRVDSMGAYHCPYFAEIDIAVFYTDSIVIPNEIPKDSCKFNIVNKHELKHTQSNKAMVSQYAERLENDIRKLLPDIEGGYVGSDKIETRLSDMKSGLDEIIKPYLTSSIKRDSAAINAQIDVPEEYQNLEKLFKLCDVRDAYYREHAKDVKKQKDDSGQK